jgi:hypothetical protein
MRCWKYKQGLVILPFRHLEGYLDFRVLRMLLPFYYLG